MPEMRFNIRWPDGSCEGCYSPSLVIKEFFEPGQAYPLMDFLELSRTALTIASDRVKARYGFPCSRATAQLANIEARASGFQEKANQHVTVISFEE